MIPDLLADARKKMETAVDHVGAEFTTVRTGRANPQILHRVQVEYYGTPTNLQQLASFSVPEPRLLVVQPLVMDGDLTDASDDFIALDNTQAGIGDTVLVNREGNGARQALNIPDGAVISVIVGIVDSVYVQL